MRCRTVLAVVWVATLSLGQGCVYRSKVQHDLPKPPGRYHGAEAKRAADAGRFWEVFGDRQLDRLMRELLEQNLSLEQAWARVEQARASLALYKAGYYPTLTAKGEAGRSHTAQVFGDMERSFSRNTFTLSLGAAYEVDLWGRVRYAVRSARHELQATEEDLRAAYLSVAAQLAEAYFLAAELRAQLELLESTVQSRARHVELVQRRFTEGVVTALDLYQAQGNLAAARAQQSLYAGRLKTTEHGIAVLLGRHPGKKVSGDLRELPRQVKDLPAGLPAQLLLRRPDLRAAHQRLMAADASVGAAVAGHYPSLSISGQVGQSFDPMAFVWSVLGSLTAPLFQGGRVSAEVKVRRAELRLALASYKATLLQALKEVEDALVSGQEIAERVKWLEAKVTAAEGALRMSTDQYAQGLISFLPVLTAEQTVYEARSELLTARRELVAARIQLARALGGGWMEAEVKRHRGEGAGG